MVTLTTTIGSSYHVLKYQKARRSYHQYGQCDVQRKRDLTTGKVTKHKARLNLHGGKQEFGMNYYETYTPVVTWFAIRLLIVFGILFD
jgi:hypothetical protein